MTFGNANERAMKKYLCLICLFVCLFVGWLVGWFCFFVSVIFVAGILLPPDLGVLLFANCKDPYRQM